MELLVGDRSRSVAALVAVKMWKDPDYRGRVLANPKAVLEAEGISVPDDAAVVVRENTADVTYVPLPRDAHVDPDPDAVAALFGRLLPIREGHEVRLVQSTEETRYFVLPQAPNGLDPERLSEAELLRVAGGFGAVVEGEAEVQTVDLGVAVTETEHSTQLVETLAEIVTESEATAT